MESKRRKVMGGCSKGGFSRYLEMEMGGRSLSAEEDLRFERKLAKRLKVKNGRLSAANDDIDALIEGIPSVATEGKDVNWDDERNENSKASFDTNKVKRRKRKTKLEENVEADINLVEAKFEQDDQIKDVDNQCSALNTCKPLENAEPANDSDIRASSSSASAKYLHPHIRPHDGDGSDEYSQLRLRVRRLLNDLSEAKVESTTTEVFTLFESASRSVCSGIVCEEVVRACSRWNIGSEHHAAVFAACAAGFACLVGIEFGAKLLSYLAIRFEEEYLNEDKISLKNMTLLLSYLYIFGVCSSELMYDFLIILSKRLTEVDVSTIWTVLQCCGMKLRGDDPNGMKNFVSSVHSRAKDLEESSVEGQSKMSKRVKFILQDIYEIKNNRKRSKEDSTKYTQVKKWLKKLKVDAILIGGLKWSQLLNPNEKGQWWLSGVIASDTDNLEEVAGTIDMEIPETKKLLQLAREQRMNTAARRAIFCIIMTGEDYIDAFEKLLRLDLPGKQDREIMRVLVDCCLQEKIFNKYYCLLASKLCSFDKNHKFTLQFCLWDHFNELDSMPLIRSMHLAKFVAEMVACFSLSLAVLKTVMLNDAIHLTPKRIMHFRVLFEAILEFPDKLVWNVFTRIATISEYESLRNGIEFFITNYVVSSQNSLAKKFKIARKALNNIEGVVM